MRSSVPPLRGILTGILTGALALAALGDPAADTTDVIVRGTDMDTVTAAVADHGGAVELEIGLIDAVSADVPVDLVDELVADPRTVEVTPDGRVELLSMYSAADLGTGQTPQEAVLALGGDSKFADGLDGSGIDIALVDSGVEASAVGGRVQAGMDVSMSTSGARDGYGHGTAMAGVIAEVSPDARIIDVKVADERGVADVSQVLAGIDWAVSHRNTDGRNIRVMSVSFGTDGTNSAATSPLAYAVEAAWRNGITVAVAAGNHGDELGRLLTPAISPWVIAVGAADTRQVTPGTLEATTIPSWSASGDGNRNPDVVAPGRSILGGLAPNSAIALDRPDAVHDGRLLGSGTSQATAFTAGVLANTLEARPDLTPDEVKAVVVNAAAELSAPAHRAGHGVIDLAELVHPTNLKGRIHGLQRHGGWSDGTGSLDGDRGSHVLEDAAGNLLTGEHTVVGPFDADAWTGSTWTGSTWTGSTWTGSTWTGSTWTGSTWTGSTWTGSTWTGSTWTGSTWTNARWGE